MGRPKKRYDFFDEPEPGGFAATDHEARYTEAALKIAAHIAKVGETTVGAISRRYPVYRDIIWDVMKTLRIDGRAIFDDLKPSPTVVRHPGYTPPQKERQES